MLRMPGWRLDPDVVEGEDAVGNSRTVLSFQYARTSVQTKSRPANNLAGASSPQWRPFDSAQLYVFADSSSFKLQAHRPDADDAEHISRCSSVMCFSGLLQTFSTSLRTL
jgi:hypothetical protein